MFFCSGSSGPVEPSIGRDVMSAKAGGRRKAMPARHYATLASARPDLDGPMAVRLLWLTNPEELDKTKWQKLGTVPDAEFRKALWEVSSALHSAPGVDYWTPIGGMKASSI